MELQLDEALIRLYTKTYVEAKEISEDLIRILLGKNLTDSQIAYFSSRIFNSDQNLLNFIDLNATDKDRDCSNIRKFLLEIIGDYIKTHKDKVLDYLSFIKDQCIRLFKKDSCGTVKEASLNPMIKMLKYFETPKIKNLFDYNRISHLLLDEIKLFKPTAGMKAQIWYLLGLLSKHFPDQMEKYQIEIQDVMYNHLNELLYSTGPQQNLVGGLLKSYQLLLERPHLTNQQIKELYVILKVTMLPIPDAKRYTVPINALRLFAKHHKMFKDDIVKDTEELYEKFIRAVGHHNTRIRDEGSEAFEAFVRELADQSNDNKLQKKKFTYLMDKFEKILDNNSSDTVSIMLVIRSVGIFSKAMKTFMEESRFKKFFAKLIDLSERKVMNVFRQTMQEEKEHEKSDFFNFTGPTFKQILYKQKLLYSFLNSFAHLVTNVSYIDERESNHLFELALLGLQYNLKFFGTYREYLYEGITSLIMGLSCHQNIFLFWLKKLISQSLLDTLKIPENVYYAGEDYHYSLRFTCELWIALLDRRKIWSETYCKIFFDEVVAHINELVNVLDLSYKTKYASEDSLEAAQPELSHISSVEYIPNNMNDSQYMYRVILFADDFLWKSNKDWVQNWIPCLLRSVFTRLNMFPRCVALLKLLTTLNELIESTNFFETSIGNDKELQGLCKLYYKELFEKCKEYQDELLNDALKVLLSIPSHFIINTTDLTANNLILTIKRALQVGLLNHSLAFAAISSLDRLVHKLPKRKAMAFLTFITPLLSDFIIYEKSHAAIAAPTASNFNLKIKEAQIDKKQVSDKVAEFLGKIGGLNHLIISSEFRDNVIDKNLAKEFIDNRSLADIKKVNLISWDHENIITFPLPLYSKKIDIDLIKIIPKVVDLASNSTDRKIKICACELLHSLMLYMIGKSAQQTNTERKPQNRINFANLYSKIFPVIFTIASDQDDVSTKIFNPLCLQIVRWMSSNKQYENKEVGCLLDTLMNCISTKDNSSLRDFAAICLGEFVKWSIKQTTPETLSQNYGNIKSVLRRIESNSTYPDMYYRYGAVLALKQVLIPLREESFLVSKYILEMSQVALNTIRTSSYTVASMSEEMNQTFCLVIKKLLEVIVKRWELVEIEDKKRGFFKDVYAFIDWLFTQLLAYESGFRDRALFMWTELVREMVRTKRNDIVSHKDWIFKKIGVHARILFKECKGLEFDTGKYCGDDIHQKIDLLIKNYRLLGAQIDTYNMLLKNNYFTFEEMQGYLDFQQFFKNTQDFIVTIIMPSHNSKDEKYLSYQSKLLQRDPQVSKVRMETLLNVFSFLAESVYVNRLLEMLFTSSFSKRDLYHLLFQILIVSPLEEGGISFLNALDCDKRRTSICLTLLLSLLKTEGDSQSQAKTFEDYFFKNFLHQNPKFNLANENSFLKDLPLFTEFQIKAIFSAYESLFTSLDINGFYLLEISEEILRFINNNLKGIQSNQEAKFVVLLTFALKFHPDTSFVLNFIDEENLIYRRFQAELIDILANKWISARDIPSKVLHKATENLLLNGLLLPLLERLIRISPESLTKACEQFVKINLSGASEKIIGNFTKFFHVFLSQTSKQKLFQQYPSFKEFLGKLILDQFDPQKSISISTILDTINLLGLYVSELDDNDLSYLDLINETLKPIQKHYFTPQNIRIAPNAKSEPDSTFEKVLKALTNAVIVANKVEFLQVAYPVIREKRWSPRYEKIVTTFCLKVAKGFSSLSAEKCFKVFDYFFNIFINKEIDKQHLEVNLRWQIMDRIGFDFLEELTLGNLEEVLMKFNSKFKEIIADISFLEVLSDFEKSFEILQEKSVAAKFFEIMYRRLPSHLLRKIKLTGQQTPIELHKTLIKSLYESTRKPLVHREFLMRHPQSFRTNFEEIMRYYHCMNYNALCAIISSTQTQEAIFNKFLFQIVREKGDCLWELLIEKREAFSFEVQTNFKIDALEKKMEKSLEGVALNSVITSKYLSESFFSQQSESQGFLIMEFNTTHNNPEKEHMEVEEEDSEEKKQTINPLDITFIQDVEVKPISKEIEIDQINNHPCMSSLLKIIDHMHHTFQGGTGMPEWMTALHIEGLREETPLHIKIFIIKLVINREDIFQPFAKQWCEVLFNYCVLKNNGAKGFHYFLRDVCTTLLAWHSQGFVLETSLSNKKICSAIISTLIKVAADKSALIFRSNLKIIAGLMSRWRKNLYVDKNIIQKMLEFSSMKDGAYLWRMTALQILDMALNVKIPIESHEQSTGSDEVNMWDDNLMNSIFENMEFSSKYQVPFLASAIYGKILKHIRELVFGQYFFNTNSTIYGEGSNPEKKLKQMETKMISFLETLGKKGDEKFAFFLENIMLSYPHILVDKIFLICQNKIHNLTKKPRGAIFNVLRIQIEKALNLENIQNDIRDICFCIRGSYDHIVRDYNDDNLVNFFQLLYQLTGIDSDHARDLIREKLEPLAQSFIEVSNESIVDILFDIIMHVFDQNDEDLKNIAKPFLIKGLNHSSATIRTKVFAFLSHENRTSLQPAARMLISLNDFYTPQSEGFWLRSVVPLMINIAQKSSDYERKVFDFPLEKSAHFKDYDPTQAAFSFKLANRSQPLTPIFTMSQQKFDNVIRSSSIHKEHQSYQSQSQDLIKKEPQSGEDFAVVRPTHRPIFSQTLVNVIKEEESIQSINDSSNPVFIDSENSDELLTERMSEKRKGSFSDSEGSNSISSVLSGTIIAGGNRARAKNASTGDFMISNALTFENISSLGNNKVRYAAEGQQMTQLREIRAKQRQLMMTRQSEIRKQQVIVSRKYRIGELPDIEIKYQDVIDPLIQIAQEDIDIAGELFIAILCGLYKGSDNENISKNFLKGLKKILNSSEQFTYHTISTVHRAFLDIMKTDSGIQVDAGLIAMSGIRSYSYHTTVLLLEQILISGDDTSGDLEKYKKIKKPAPRRKTLNSSKNLNRVEFREEAAQVWLHLIEIYGALNEDDGVRGLLSKVVNDERIREALDLKLNQNFSRAIDIFEEILEKYEVNKDSQDLFHRKIYEYIREENRESLAALGKWDVILEHTEYPINGPDQMNLIPIQNLKEKDAYYVIKGLIYNDEYWSTMNDSVSVWRINNEKVREFVDTRYSWEMGLLAITQKDYDRALYFATLEKENFLKKWEKLDLFSEAAKHDQLQHLQKMTEFQEFLQYIDTTRHAERNEITSKFNELIDKWIRRSPSATNDSVNTWNDILFAREMFCNLISYQYYGDDTDMVESKIADLYVQSARGLMKKGALENADSLLNKAVKLKSKHQYRKMNCFDYKTVSSVIKLKLKALELDENRFCQDNNYLEKYKRILDVLEGHTRKLEGRIGTADFNKILMLKIFGEEKTLSYLCETFFLFKEQGDNQSLELSMEIVEQAVSIDAAFNAVINSTELALKSADKFNEDHTRNLGKIYFKYAVFTDKLLRLYEEVFNDKQQTNNLIFIQMFTQNNTKFMPFNLGKMFLSYICDAFILGHYPLQQVPKVFSLLLKYPELGPLFQEKANNIPVWIFLKWLPQMMSMFYSKELNSYIDNVFNKIVDLYPQAIIYQFNVSYNRLSQLENVSAKNILIGVLQQKLEKFQNHYAFIQSLNQLTHPEHKILYYYLEKIKEVLMDSTANKKEQLNLIGNELWRDIFATSKPFVKDLLGTYVLKFARDWEKEFIKAFGRNFERLENYNWTNFLADQSIQNVIKKLKTTAEKISSGSEKLSVFSSWLSTYDSNNYLYEAKIEIPGQYSGYNEPFLLSHVTISNFGQSLLIMSSLRKPKKLVIHGSNEKLYSFLVKGIEDLRLDQRIQQLFSLMNDIFLQDSECQKRDLKINTFQVIPMTKMLGILEWVDNTVPIKALLGKELQNSYQIDIDDNQARKARIDWLGKISQSKSLAEQHISLLGLDEKAVLDNFNIHQNLIPGLTLKKSLERLCCSPGAFLYIKNKFIRNYATLSVGCYILGVGDRHLENFLINTQTGEVVPIDFGYSFGQGLTLPIPELMPFRLTRVIECLMQPMGVDGIFRNTMIKSFIALRESRNVILDCCEIFIKDPLIDWIKFAKAKVLEDSKALKKSAVVPKERDVSSTTDSLGFVEIESMEWYPMKKIEAVRKKLTGAKPSSIMLSELEDSKFFRNPQWKEIKASIIKIVGGTTGTYRETLNKDYLSVTEQVDALIDQATDPNILGRTWIGWAPYV